MDEVTLMEALRVRLQSGSLQEVLADVGNQLLADLRSDPTHPKSTFRSIPLSTYGDDLPPDIASSWVFALRSGFDHPAERHPNSIQRMFALTGAGRFEWWDGERWVSRLLEPGGEGLSIAIDTWHRTPAQAQDWAVVSFHTARPDELVEIVGDPGSGAVTSSRAYLSD